MSWLLDVTPYWVWIIVAGVILVATLPWWSAIWAVTPRPVKIALVAIAGLATAYLAGRNRGVANEKQRQKDADANAVKGRLETNAEVNNMPAARRDGELDKWMRD